MIENLQGLRKKYWDVRTVQERQLLKLLALLLTPVLLYLIVWQPAHTATTKLRASLPSLYIDADRMRSNAEEIDAMRHLAKPALLDAVSLKASVEDSAERYELKEAISTLDLQEPNAVRISFASVSFELWLRWLRALQLEQHIRADSASVAMLPQAGMVKINATLINGAKQ